MPINGFVNYDKSLYILVNERIVIRRVDDDMWEGLFRYDRDSKEVSSLTNEDKNVLNNLGFETI